MRVKEAQVLYDGKGKKTHVILPYRKYEQLLDLLDDVLDRKAMDEVRTEKTVAWNDAKKLIKKRS